MFRKLARGRDALYAGLNKENFEAAIKAHFDIADVLELNGGERILYRLNRRG